MSDLFATWPALTLRRSRDGLNVTGPVAAQFGTTVESKGGEAPADPSCSWSWDGQRLTARTDRYGFLNLFYSASDNGIMISPSVAALLRAGASPDVDAAAVAVFLRTGFFVGDDTPFQAIRVLPPGGVLSWHGGEVTVQAHRPRVQAYTGSYDSAVDEYIDRFAESVRRRDTLGTLVVPLSGGRDSRHIFLELCKAGRRPDVALSIGSPGGYSLPDVETARVLAARTGVRHVTAPLPEARWCAQQESITAAHLCTSEHWWFEPLVRYLREVSGAGTSVTVFEGVAGDVLSTPFLKTPLRQTLYDQGRLRDLAENLSADEGYLPSVLPRDWYRRFSRELAMERLVLELEKHREAPNPLSSFFFFNRTRRVTSIPPTVFFGAHARVWCPYLDADLWNFLASLPPAIVQSDTGGSFHDVAIRRAYPDFADIPYAGKRYTRSRNSGYERRAIIDMARAVRASAPELVRRSFLWPRLARGLVDSSSAADTAGLSSMVAYLTQLSRAMTTSL
ncbi:MAG: hypothetical protein ACR2M1_04190 [Gemmatimonadaceae bacterium]